jgi:hypothetical protein
VVSQGNLTITCPSDPRSSIRDSAASEGPRIFRCGDRDAGDWNWRKHRRIQRAEQCPAATAPLSRGPPDRGALVAKFRFPAGSLRDGAAAEAMSRAGFGVADIAGIWDRYPTNLRGADRPGRLPAPWFQPTICGSSAFTRCLVTTLSPTGMCGETIPVLQS